MLRVMVPLDLPGRPEQASNPAEAAAAAVPVIPLAQEGPEVQAASLAAVVDLGPVEFQPEVRVELAAMESAS